MNVQRTPMLVFRCVQTPLVATIVPVTLAIDWVVTGEPVKVSH